MGVNFDWNSRQRGKAWPKGRRATTCHAGNSCEHVHKANSWRRAFYREDRHRCLWRTATDFRCDQKIGWSTQGPLRRFTWPTQRFVLSARRSRKAQRRGGVDVARPKSRLRVCTARVRRSKASLAANSEPCWRVTGNAKPRCARFALAL